jgi:phosphopantothenoylcysteine decarboxylase / phosphopantothenate---cysteine ligase
MRIILGISASIAAYKSLELIRNLRKKSIEIFPILTENAKDFVSPLSVETLSENSLVSKKQTHIDLDRLGDVLVIAPCTANVLAKCANGIADDKLTTTFLNFKGPKVLVPAMHDTMFSNSITKSNIDKLRDHGIYIVGPTEGDLACGDKGNGRMAPLAMVETCIEALSKNKIVLKQLKAKKIVVTAGGTIEAIDNVRHISNASTGRLGKCIADIACLYGADVHLITTKDEQPTDYRITEVMSSSEMRDSVLKEVTNGDVLIMAAAVSDYTVADFQRTKIKRSTNISLDLVGTEDILKSVASLKLKSGFPKKVIGFCLEDENLDQSAIEKLKSKSLDMIVANLSDNIGNQSRTIKIFTPKSSRPVFMSENKTVIETALSILENIVNL